MALGLGRLDRSGRLKRLGRLGRPGLGAMPPLVDTPCPPLTLMGTPVTHNATHMRPPGHRLMGFIGLIGLVYFVRFNEGFIWFVGFVGFVGFKCCWYPLL